MPFRLRTSIVRACLFVPAFTLIPLLHAAEPATGNASTVFTTGVAVNDATRAFRYQSEGFSSSSDAVADGSPTAALDAELASLADDGGQPPPGRRRTYGRSRYQDRMHNADGSTKIAFVAGAGLNLPVANTAKFYTPSYAITAGAGYNFNKTFGALLEFHYQHMGLTSGAINSDYLNTYNFFIAQGNSASDVANYLAGFDANAHIFGISLNPVVNLVGQGKVGAYITGGLGYYRKTTNFTLPQLTQNIYGGVGYVNSTFDSYGAGGVGYNGGVGLTYRISEFSSERLFVEARYEWLNLGKTSTQFFPYNSRNSEVVPITAGIRF